jgi:uncharacterized DUF497 family protein
MAFVSILWDLDDDPNGNVQHCADHDPKKDEVSEVLQDPEDTGTSRQSGRPIAFGPTSTGRYIAVVYTIIDEFTVRPVTAFDVPRRR